MISLFISVIALSVVAVSFLAVLFRPGFIIRSIGLNTFIRKSPLLASTLGMGLLLAALDLILGLPERMAADMALAVLPLVVLPSGASERDRMRFCLFVLTLGLVSLLCSVAYALGWMSGTPPYLHPLSVCLASVLAFAVFLGCNISHIRSSAEDFAPLSVSGFISDILYLCTTSLLLMFSAMSCWMSVMTGGEYPGLTEAIDTGCFVCVSAVLVCGLFRRAGSRHFLFLERFELRLSKEMEACMSDRGIRADRKDNLYRNVFSRIEEYFRSESPYLDMELNIGEVSERVFTNKVYVSRAISECSGSNFCQYVNGYRIRYAMDCFRRNPALKVSDLSAMSGFRTVASYNMAFRRIVGELPSEWMRRTGGVIRRNAAKLGAVAPVMQAV